jgi:two-component system, LytTR family, sensor kinase
LVENAFKHGSQEGGLILARLSLKNNILSFSITNPVAEKKFAEKPEEGIGLPNIKRQLELLYRDFYLDSFTVEHKFTIHLTIDLSGYAGIELFDSRG